MKKIELSSFITSLCTWSIWLSRAFSSSSVVEGPRAAAAAVATAAEAPAAGGGGLAGSEALEVAAV